MLLLDIARVIWGLVRIVLTVLVIWRFIPYRKTIAAGIVGWLAWHYPEFRHVAALAVGQLAQ